GQREKRQVAHPVAVLVVLVQLLLLLRCLATHLAAELLVLGPQFWQGAVALLLCCGDGLLQAGTGSLGDLAGLLHGLVILVPGLFHGVLGLRAVVLRRGRQCVIRLVLGLVLVIRVGLICRTGTGQSHRCCAKSLHLMFSFARKHFLKPQTSET